MEFSSDGWIVLAVMLLILGGGGGAIAITTLKPLGKKTPFKTPITTLSMPISGEARRYFNQGVMAYREQVYGKAIDCFSKVVELEPDLAEAFHNRGRAQANFARKQYAVKDLVTASELYSRQNTASGIDWIKADLATLSNL